MLDRIKYAHMSPVLVVGLIVTSLLLVIVTKLSIAQLFQVEPFPYLLNFFVIILAAWFGGFKGGIFATVLSSLTIWLVFLLPPYTGIMLSTRESIGLFFFNLEAVTLSYIVSKLRVSKNNLFQAFDDLKQQQARFQLLLDNANGYAVFFVNQHGSVSDWNDGAQRFFGYDAHDVNGVTLPLFFKDLGFTREWLRKLLKNPNQSWSENEVLVTRKDGSQFWSQVSITPIRHSATSFRGFGVVCRDLTYQKEISQQREQFLNDMSHELKTPLTSLKLWADIMNREKPTQQVGKLHQHITKLTELVNTLLDLNHIQSGRFTLQLSKQLLPTVIHELTQVTSQSHFVSSKQGNLPALEVLVDMTRLRIAVGIFSQALRDHVRLSETDGSQTIRVKVLSISASHFQLVFWSPTFTPKVLQLFLQNWRALLTHQRLPLSAKKFDSKGFFAAHVLDLHGQLPVLETKPAKGQTVSLVLNIKLFTQD